MKLSFVVGPLTIVAAIVAFVVYLVTVYLRESRGEQARVSTLATSRPVYTVTTGAILSLAVVLLAVRLGSLP